MSFSLFAKSPSSQIKIPVKRYKLKNGMTILLNPNPDTTMSSYYLGFATGSRHEREGITGISHMFEHLMFKGTKKYPDIDRLYSKNGIVGMNAMTSKDYTAYIGHFTPDKLELILDAESDRMVHLFLTQEGLDKERKAVQEERRLRVDNQPKGMLFEALYETVFKLHSYKWPVIGHAKDIADYSLKDLKEWYKTYYSPNNATFVLSGNFSEKEARNLIKKYFGSLAPKEISKEKDILEPPQTEARTFILKKPIQTKLAFLAYRLPGKRVKDVVALEIACDVLGTGESSRLYKSLARDKKWVSDISCFILNNNKHSLLLIYYSLLKNVSEQKVKEAIQDEIYSMAAQKISSYEIEKVKNIKLVDIINQLKRSSSRAQLLGSYEVNFDSYKNIYKDLDRFNTISSEFIQSRMKKYLKSNQSSYLVLKPED